MTTGERGTASGTHDAASTGGLTESMEAILPALERFLRFEGPDPAARRSEWYPRILEALPEHGEGREAVLADLRDVLIANGLRTGHPGFSGWVTTIPTTVGAVADLAQTVAAAQRWWASPGNRIDSVALRWLVDLLGFPASFGGAFTTGGATANLIGLGMAREHAGQRLGVQSSRDGLDGLPEPRVYASAEAHHVIGRALGVLGIGRHRLALIPIDATGRMNTDVLQATIDADIRAGRTPVAVVGTAGDVNMGLVDDLPELGRIAHERGVWFHVDGAYGGFGLLDERVRPLYGDVADYDSFAVDPHKWLAAPVGTGAIIVRDEDILGRAFTVEPGDYDAVRAAAASRDPGRNDLGSQFDELGEGSLDFGLEFSTPARGIAVWAILREIGAHGMRARVTRHLDCARRVAERARASDELELLAEPVLSICCFRYRPAGWTDEGRLDVLNDEILHAVRARGRCYSSSTRVNGRLAVRPCFINPRTTMPDADALVDEVLEVGRELSGHRRRT